MGAPARHHNHRTHCNRCPILPQARSAVAVGTGGGACPVAAKENKRVRGGLVVAAWQNAQLLADCFLQDGLLFRYVVEQ